MGKRDEDFVDTEQARSFRQVDQRVMESGLSLVDERQVTYASDGMWPASNRSNPCYVTPGTHHWRTGVGARHHAAPRE